MAKVSRSLAKRISRWLRIEWHLFKAQAVKLVTLALVSTVLFLALLEGTARVAWHFGARPTRVQENPARHQVPDVLLHHKWRPNVRLPSRGVFINRQSWVEAYDVHVRKPPGVFRIFFLGDSNTQGVVPMERKMVETTERWLNNLYQRRGITIEAINTGTSSYSNFQYYLLVKDVLPRYSPDLVIINVDMTDVVNDNFYRTTAVFDADGYPVAINTGHPDGVVLTPFGWQVQSRVQRWYRYLVRKSKVVYYLDRLMPKDFDTVVQQDQRGSDTPANWLALEYTDQIRRNVAYSMRILGRTIQLLQERRIKVLVTGVPHHPQYTGEWSAEPHRILRETAARHNAPYLDLYAAMMPHVAGTPRERFYLGSWDPTHFNEAGNRLWATILLEFLPKSGLLP